MADNDIKLLIVELITLCEKLYPDEWRGKYTSSQMVFRDWLNEKTGLNVDHIEYDQREGALRTWVEVLQGLDAVS
jgi:hypothetical protein